MYLSPSHLRFAVIFILILIGLNVFQCKNKQQLAQEVSLFEALMNDTLIKERDKNGELTARSQILQSDNIALFTQLESADTTIIRLQKVVEEYKKKLKAGSSVTIISTQGSVTGNTSTVTVIPDKDCPDANPTYTGDYDFEGWVWGDVVAKKDTITLNIKYRDEFDVIIGEERQGLFKKRKLFTEIRSKNPYTDVKEYRTYKVTDNTKKKRFSVGPTLNYGFGENLNTGFTLGIGITYGIIQF